MSRTREPLITVSQLIKPAGREVCIEVTCTTYDRTVTSLMPFYYILNNFRNQGNSRVSKKKLPATTQTRYRCILFYYFGTCNS